MQTQMIECMECGHYDEAQHFLPEDDRESGWVCPNCSKKNVEVQE